jgi:uncharacterized protein YciI
MSIPVSAYLVYAPDSGAPGTFERRMELHPEHIAGLNKALDSGLIKIGGVSLNPEESSDNKILGSLLFLNTKDEKEARELVESDVYYKENIWDRERISILPYHQGIGTVKL